MFKNINPVVRIMVIVDFFFNSAFGSFGPVFAIFITGQIVGGSARVAGFAAAFYWITKSIVQLPIARFLDKTDGEYDDFWAFFFGYLFTSLVPIAYIFSTQPWHLYVAQAFMGFCMAWAVPAWYAIFTRHVDKWRIGFEWSLQSVFSVGLATAGAAALGGYVAEILGFKALFMAAAALIFLSSLALLTLRRYLIAMPKPQEKVLPEKRS